MASVFAKIIKGEIPCHKIAENEDCFAFLDIHPLNKGHVLVVPKKEIDYIFDIDDDLLSKLITFSKKIAVAMEKNVECERIGVSVVGLEVPHAHIHLIPINNVEDMNFSRPKLKVEDHELAELAGKIRSSI